MIFLLKVFFTGKMSNRYFREAIAVTNVSAAIGNKLKELFGLKNVRVIHNTVDTNFFFYTDQRGSEISALFMYPPWPLIKKI